MTARPDITKPENMLDIQGDRVLVYNRVNGDDAELANIMTIVRVIGIGTQEMRLVNKEGKTRKPDWLFTQKWYDSLKPARENKENAKWEVTLKAKSG